MEKKQTKSNRKGVFIMTNFIVLVLAICVAQFLTAAIVFALMSNKRVIKAYMKWVNKMTDYIMYGDDDEE